MRRWPGVAGGAGGAGGAARRSTPLALDERASGSGARRLPRAQRRVHCEPWPSPPRLLARAPLSLRRSGAAAQARVRRCEAVRGGARHKGVRQKGVRHKGVRHKGVRHKDVRHKGLTSKSVKLMSMSRISGEISSWYFWVARAEGRGRCQDTPGCSPPAHAPPAPAPWPRRVPPADSCRNPLGRESHRAAGGRPQRHRPRSSPKTPPS